MISPLPRAKRAKNPRHETGELHVADEPDEDEAAPEKPHAQSASAKAKVPVNEQPASGGLNNPFAGLEIK
jgi:hypothetical protein